MKAVLEQAVEFIIEQQKPDSSFTSQSSPTLHPFVSEKTYRTPFPTALILSALSEVCSSKFKKTRQRALSYLLKQESEWGSWNYWDHNSLEHKNQPYPDDLDDTFCALSALWETAPNQITGTRLAQATKLLIQTESAPGGPYRTWVVGKQAAEHWLDVDPVVNSNIARFLSTQGVNPLPLHSYIEKSLKQDKSTSPYYPNQYAFFWFTSRWYRGSLQSMLRRRLLRNSALSEPSSALPTALALAAYLQWGGTTTEVKKSQIYLLKKQKNGIWPAEGFCLDPAQKGQTYYAGSEVLTTAFCLDALQLYQNTLSKEIQTRRLTSIRSEVMKEVTQTLQSMKESKVAYETVLNKILRIENKTPILTLAEATCEAFGVSQAQIPDSLRIRLGAASTLGWLSYTILDDFLDGQGNRQALPVALVAHRAMVTLYEKVLPTGFVSTTLNTIDAANTWELAHCRFDSKAGVVQNNPNYKNLDQLADRSLGHLLTPLAVLKLSEKYEQAPELTAFFRNFLIARQLSDDALDWKTDLEAGHINSVASEMLKAKKFPLKKALSKLTTELEKSFEEKGKNTTTKLIGLHLKKARKSLNILEQQGSLKNPQVLITLLLPLEVMQVKLVREKQLADEFIKNF